MPSTPEIPNIQSLIWRIKILGKPDIKKTRRTHGHVGITGKIIVDLKGIADRCYPCFDKIQRSRIIKTGGRPYSKRISNKNFFKKPDGKNKKTA